VTLHRLIKERGGRLSITEALSLTEQMCTALAYAHTHTIHRDLKPQNVMVRPDGRVKILDFGLAKVMSPGRMTKSSMALGTAYYQAPEQSVHAEDVDQSADIYSVGVMLYEMLTGVIPTAMAEPPSSEVPEVSKQLDALLAGVSNANRRSGMPPRLNWPLLSTLLKLTHWASGCSAAQGPAVPPHTLDCNGSGIADGCPRIHGLCVLLTEPAHISTRSQAFLYTADAHAGKASL